MYKKKTALNLVWIVSPRLEMKVTKSSGGVPRLSYTGRDDRHFLPTGLYIIKTVNGELKCGDQNCVCKITTRWRGWTASTLSSASDAVA